MPLHTNYISNETMQSMVKFVDNNYRQFQKERKSKGMHTAQFIMLNIKSIADFTHGVQQETHG